MSQKQSSTAAHCRCNRVNAAKQSASAQIYVTIAPMQKFLRFPGKRTCLPVVALAFLLLACSPKFDWRQVRGTPVPFTVLLPAKPATVTRPVELAGIKVDMTMTAAEIDGVTFAVGAAILPDAAAVPAALSSMKAGLARNINGSVRRETGAGTGPLELEATGRRAPDAPELLLLARFFASDARVYQVVVLGPSSKLARDEADTFFSSFKPN